MTVLSNIEGLEIIGTPLHQYVHNHVLHKGKKLLGLVGPFPLTMEQRRKFRLVFGLSIDTCISLLELLKQRTNQPELHPKHMYWTLMFLEQYPTENSLASAVAASKKTVRKWVWLLIDEIEALHDLVVRMNCANKLLLLHVILSV